MLKFTEGLGVMSEMNQPVLVLNANFEPLNVCNTRRAMGLIISGKAEMVANGRGYVRTPRFRYPRPSVIRLGYMIKRPRARVKLTKREVFRRDNTPASTAATNPPT